MTRLPRQRKPKKERSSSVKKRSQTCVLAFILGVWVPMLFDLMYQRIAHAVVLSKPGQSLDWFEGVVRWRSWILGRRRGCPSWQSLPTRATNGLSWGDHWWERGFPLAACRAPLSCWRVKLILCGENNSTVQFFLLLPELHF